MHISVHRLPIEGKLAGIGVQLIIKCSHKGIGSLQVHLATEFAAPGIRCSRMETGNRICVFGQIARNDPPQKRNLVQKIPLQRGRSTSKLIVTAKLFYSRETQSGKMVIFLWKMGVVPIDFYV